MQKIFIISMILMASLLTGCEKNFPEVGNFCAVYIPVYIDEGEAPVEAFRTIMHNNATFYSKCLEFPSNV